MAKFVTFVAKFIRKFVAKFIRKFVAKFIHKVVPFVTFVADLRPIHRQLSAVQVARTKMLHYLCLKSHEQPGRLNLPRLPGSTIRIGLRRTTPLELEYHFAAPLHDQPDDEL